MGVAVNLVRFERKYQYWSLALNPLRALIESTMTLKAIHKMTSTLCMVMMDTFLQNAVHHPFHDSVPRHFESVIECTANSKVMEFEKEHIAFSEMTTSMTSLIAHWSLRHDDDDG